MDTTFVIPWMFHNYDIIQSLRAWAGVSLEPLWFKLVTKSRISQRLLQSTTSLTMKRPKINSTPSPLHPLSISNDRRIHRQPPLLKVPLRGS